MIKLKTLLLECFYTSQWIDILQKYPQIVDLLKNDPLPNIEKYLYVSFGNGLGEFFLTTIREHRQNTIKFDLNISPEPIKQNVKINKIIILRGY